MKIIAQFLLVILITAVLAELGLRVLHMVQPVFIFQDDSYNRWRRAPGAQELDIKINSHGFKDTEFGPKKPGTYRIVALGDSFTYGAVPHRNNFLTLIEQALQKNGKFELFNLGIAGTAPQDYLSLFKREGLAQDPDMVLLSLFIGNDIDETDVGNKPREDNTVSYLWELMRFLFVVYPGLEDKAPNPEVVVDYHRYCDDCPTFKWRDFLYIESRRAKIYFTNVTKTEPKINRVLEIIDEIKVICDSRGIKFSLVLIPGEVQVDNGLADTVIRHSYEAYRQFWDPSYPNALIAQGLRRRSIDFLDLLRPIGEEHAKQRLYIPRNTHWNILGNKVAAEHILGHLRPQFVKEGLIR